EDYVSHPKIVVDLDPEDSIVPETVDLAKISLRDRYA
ncbi:hypothetical protein A2U01_0071374, partial [Trifolium medium]|nr:hypothetical protein [Trifolium medium]